MLANFGKIVKFGEDDVRCICGDFCFGTLVRLGRNGQIAGDLEAPAAQQLEGKNASCLALVIGALDLMFKRTLDGVVLVRSDCDFTRLALRRREVFRCTDSGNAR